MSDDPYPSLQPVVTSIAGYFIAITMIALPLFAVAGVRSLEEGVLPKANGNTTEAVTKRKLSTVDACRHFWISSNIIRDRNCTLHNA